MINTITVPRARKTKEGSYQTSLRLSPVVDQEIIDQVLEVNKFLSKNYQMKSLAHAFKFLVRKGYEQWKKENKS